MSQKIFDRFSIADCQVQQGAADVHDSQRMQDMNIVESSNKSMLNNRAANRVRPYFRAAPSHPFRVLVIESDEDLLRLYQSLLSCWPMSPIVSLAHDAKTGLWLVGLSQPDLLIAGLEMPDMDGFEMVNILYQATVMCHTTLVVVTGMLMDEVISRHEVPPEVTVLTKPIPFDRLLNIANGIYNTRSAMASAHVNGYQT